MSEERGLFQESAVDAPFIAPVNRSTPQYATDARACSAKGTSPGGPERRAGPVRGHRA